jgi:hypothetical protein
MSAVQMEQNSRWLTAQNKLAQLRKIAWLPACSCISLASSSGYFENVWVWVANHDLDAPVDSNSTTTTSTQISIYAARGVLILLHIEVCSD